MPFLDNIDDGKSYSEMSGLLDARLLKALDVMGFENMTPVQQMVLTQLPSFQSDCLVQAKTGTGKTAAFLLPCLHTLLNSRRPLPKGQVGLLIISPTRELALQIAKECDQLTSQLGENKLECHVAFGGSHRASNLARFMNGSPSILVATPGRLKDYLSESNVVSKFADVRTVILDEADTMLESGFLTDVREILKLLPPKSAGWQAEPPTLDKVPQYHVIMPSVIDTFNTLASLLNHELTPDSKAIVFGVTANMVALYSNLFAQRLTSLRVFELHSRLSQNVRTRTTNEFKTATSGIMFASDVIGRGMDFPNVDLVVQVGLPSSAEQYIHRVGRTGRAGNTGRAIILLTQAESFFIAANRRLPIQPHPQTATIVSNATTYAPQVEQAMYAIEETVKQRAYSSFLGFFAGSGLLKPLRMDKVGLVRMANDMATKGMHCPEPPAMEKKTVGKMGLKGVPGFNYASANAAAGDNPAQPPRRPRPINKEGSNGSRNVLSPKSGGTGAVKKKQFRSGRRGGKAGTE
ncbi:hypothetical protein LTR05_007044 [Lithohypha guttulata]|uniref:ATP-dependent RNA helicase n=1 Tax=Lithohypha guttulata TaxID=1690604 RepID=A0AAN7SWA3_9EURO|nr:hypothetical protein LTR05_007044 [Lithohypha guttulata]